MVLTSFGDIGKCTKDIFTKHFKSGLFNFDYRSKPSDDIDLHIQCDGNDNSVAAKSEITFKPMSTVSVKTTVDTNNQITSDVQVNPKSTGSQHNIIATIDQSLEKRYIKLKNGLKGEKYNVELDMDFRSRYPQTVGSIAIGDKNLILGGQIVLDTEKLSIKEHTLCLGYAGKDYETYGAVTNAKNVEWRFFQKNRNISIGLMFGWSGGLSSTTYGLASIYQIDQNTFVKGKIDQNAKMSIAYGMKATPDIELVVTVGSCMSPKRSSAQGGISFEISN